MGETGEVQAPVSKVEKPKRQPSCRSLKRKFSAEDESSPENNNRSLRRSLRRGSSFTFLTPGPQWDFSLPNHGLLMWPQTKRWIKEIQPAPISYPPRQRNIMTYRELLALRGWPACGFTVGLK
ncbi:hypothetical protein INR49_000213 [Caranx melampygus]|nr:hypothetical protein INR49_000213 [Caranx melampygus]